MRSPSRWRPVADHLRKIATGASGESFTNLSGNSSSSGYGKTQSAGWSDTVGVQKQPQTAVHAKFSNLAQMVPSRVGEAIADYFGNRGSRVTNRARWHVQ